MLIPLDPIDLHDHKSPISHQPLSNASCRMMHNSTFVMYLDIKDKFNLLMQS